METKKLTHDTLEQNPQNVVEMCIYLKKGVIHKACKFSFRTELFLF
jgi:hypothetical protein